MAGSFAILPQRLHENDSPQIFCNCDFIFREGMLLELHMVSLGVLKVAHVKTKQNIHTIKQMGMGQN